MVIRFDEIGRRLRAYRAGKNLTASEVAERIGVSRAAVYRLEKGELVKIETLEKLSALLDVSLPSLMGVGVEYYSNAIAFFERLRQLQQDAVHMLGNYAPVTYLLMSDNYLKYLRMMLTEALEQIESEKENAADTVGRLLEILAERRTAHAKRRTPLVSIVNVHDIERFLRSGLIGRFDLPVEVLAERRRAARAEFEHLIRVMQRPPLGIQLGIVDVPATQTFQVIERLDGAAVTLSPYRLGAYPNITSGIAIITSAPEAVRHFKEAIIRQWDIAYRGESGARILQSILDRVEENAPAPLRPVALTAAGGQSKS
jgi:transcriptional regulator with XRE-family HTH domain